MNRDDIIRDGRGMSGEKLSRRDFIRASAAATIFAATQTDKLGAAEQITVNGLPAAVLGRTGLKVTKISFGGVLALEPALVVRVDSLGDMALAAGVDSPVATAEATVDMAMAVPTDIGAAMAGHGEVMAGNLLFPILNRLTLFDT